MTPPADIGKEPPPDAVSTGDGFAMTFTTYEGEHAGIVTWISWPVGDKP